MNSLMKGSANEGFREIQALMADIRQIKEEFQRWKDQQAETVIHNR